MAEASSILREIPFALDYPSDELLGEPSFAGNTTTVQGIIDCVCLYGDGSVALIDYKSDTVNERAPVYVPVGADAAIFRCIPKDTPYNCRSIRTS